MAQVWGLCFAFLAFVQCQARLKKLPANSEFFGRLACSGWDKQCVNYSTRPPKRHFHPGQRPQDDFKVISLLIFWSLLLLCLGVTMMQLFSTSHDETVPERMFPNPVSPSLSMSLTLESSVKGLVYVGGSLHQTRECRRLSILSETEITESWCFWKNEHVLTALPFYSLSWARMLMSFPFGEEAEQGREPRALKHV